MSAAAGPRWTRRRLASAGAALAVIAASGAGIYLSTGQRAAQRETPKSEGIGWAAAPEPLPEVRFLGAGDTPHSLAEFRGKLVLLNVWATWCAPCREEMPALDRLQRALGGPDFQVIALSIDSGGEAAVRRFYDEVGVRSLAIYVDPSAQAASSLRAVGVPTTLLLDRAGGERWRRAGPAHWDAPAIIEFLRARKGTV